MDKIQKLAQQQNPALPTEIEIISMDGKTSTGSARKADRIRYFMIGAGNL